MNAVKVRLEDKLFGAGVKLIYVGLPVGICVKEGRVHGLILDSNSKAERSE